MSVGSWCSLQRICKAFSSWPLDTSQRGLSGTENKYGVSNFFIAVKPEQGIYCAPKKDPPNKHKPQIARTAFGKRQPKDDLDSKKHPYLYKISRSASDLKSAHVYQPDPSSKGISYVDTRSVSTGHQTARTRRRNLGKVGRHSDHRLACSKTSNHSSDEILPQISQSASHQPGRDAVTTVLVFSI